jgi:predicted permease
MLAGIGQDLVYAWRRHRRDPALAALVIATLGLAIGLNASVFAIYAAAALRPWAVPAADRMVNVYALPPSRPRDAVAIGAAIAQVRFVNTHATLLDGLAATRDLSLRIGDEAPPPGSPSQAVTGNFFDVLKVDMARGRGFLPDEDQTAVPRAVVVLSHRTWQQTFAGEEAIVGRRIVLDDVPFIVVGVAPAGFGGTSDRHAGAWVPLSALRLLRPLDKDVDSLLTSPAHCCSSVFGRLRPGVSAGQATAQLDALVGAFARQHGLEVGGVHLTDTAMLSHPGSWGRARFVFGLLQGAMLLVLLLASANVGNLLLSRALARQHEMATRLSLGATRTRLVRQLLIESLLPAAAGGALGLGLAHALPAWLFTRVFDTQPNLAPTPGVEGVAFTFVITLAAVLAFGLAPALHGSRADLLAALRGRAASPRLRLRSALLSVQIAACVVMLVCAALTLRGIQAIGSRDPGFRVEGLDVLQFDVPSSTYGPAQVDAVVRTLRAWQGASPVPTTLTRTPPLAEARHSTSMRRADEPDSAERSVIVHAVDPAYFDVLGVPLVAGRAFTPADGEDVVVVNEAFVARELGGRHALGATLVMGGKHTRRVVGIARNAHVQQLDRVDPIVFGVLGTRDVPRMLLPSTPGLAASVIATMQQLDPRIRVRRTSLATMVDEHMKDPRLAGQLAAVLGLVALVLATMGLAGVCGYLVRQRTREIGIRLALGATRRHVLAQVFAMTGRSTAWGLAIGSLLAAAIASLVISSLPGVRLGDATAYVASAAALSLGALAATYLPARRALRIAPALALRQE